MIPHSADIRFEMMNFKKIAISLSLSDIENMIPFERDIYITLLEQHLEEEEERAKQNG